ncbi:hypothetical protein Hypma_006248 [Hypsizygus marmoreus]|uniref:Uncharacterized protein n=1 Tax=Hypsizygus marmoreus TaxID=39966 RepID=A0A369K4X7_HYPMA|nr:hypothetical protein Hypma_006248 [Hypsizygus marmoreus]
MPSRTPLETFKKPIEYCAKPFKKCAIRMKRLKNHLTKGRFSEPSHEGRRDPRLWKVKAKSILKRVLLRQPSRKKGPLPSLGALETVLDIQIDTSSLHILQEIVHAIPPSTDVVQPPGASHNDLDKPITTTNYTVFSSLAEAKNLSFNAESKLSVPGGTLKGARIRIINHRSRTEDNSAQEDADSHVSVSLDATARNSQSHTQLAQPSEFISQGVVAEHESGDARVNPCFSRHRKLIINALPDEILESIFFACLPCYDNTPWPSLRQAEAPFILRHVCHQWNDVALGCPQLWGTIAWSVALRNSLDTPAHRDGIRTFIERRKALAFDSVSFHIGENQLTPTSKEIIVIFLPIFSRCRHLQLDFPDFIDLEGNKWESHRAHHS